jgi:hypothetical protein
MSTRSGPADPQAVDRALAYLRDYGARYTRESLEASLREQGFTESDLAEAWRRFNAEQPRDLRARAAAILVVAFVGVWLAIAIPLSANYTYGPIGAAILGALLLVVLVPALFAVDGSSRLREGVTGALVAMLAIPFVLLFVIAGLCVSTTRPFGG